MRDRIPRPSALWLARLLLLLLCSSAGAQEIPDYRLFFEAASTDEKTSKQALDRIALSWRDNYAALVVDLARLLPGPSSVAGDEEPASVDPEGGFSRGPIPSAAGGFPEAGVTVRQSPRARVRERLVRFLEKRTKQRFGHDLRRWRRWMWSLPDEPHPQYALFKASLYGAVDPRMSAFFPAGVKTLIRLDEIDWGGVAVNGIPPLDRPKLVPAKEAAYLGERNVVFGVVLNGEARAYPKRILAWHELARDRVGGVELTIVYCTLCGTVVPYGSQVGGRLLTFGTSGLLYRANKLMFDEATLSLWSTSEGRPVVGSLAGSGLQLTPYPVVTTTWREWVAVHPDSTVLSLDTGFTRDYSEGAAYREYFSTDRLLFEVPKTDPRLKNKAEVLALLLPSAGAPDDGERRALALSVDFLKKNPVYHHSFAGHDLVAITTPDGANRVYESGATRFRRRLSDGRIEDRDGRAWRLEEHALVLDGGDATRPRVPARRAFWFGWYAQFPDTALVR